MHEVDLVALHGLMEAGQLPIEEWNYIEDALCAVVHMDPSYECLRQSSTFDAAWDEVPMPYRPHDLSVWGKGGRDRPVLKKKKQLWNYKKLKTQ